MKEMTGVLVGLVCSTIVFMGGVALGACVTESHSKKTARNPVTMVDDEDEQETEFRTEAKVGF